MCTVVEDVDEKQVDELLQIGKDLGRWGPTNQCQSYVSSVIRASRTAEWHKKNQQDILDKLDNLKIN